MKVSIINLLSILSGIYYKKHKREKNGEKKQNVRERGKKIANAYINNFLTTLLEMIGVN